jgi:hypothetical protein
MNEHVTLEELTDSYRDRRRHELLPDVERSLDQRDEDWYDDAQVQADRSIEAELYEVTRPRHTIERGFFWGTLGLLALGLAIPDNSGASMSDLELAIAGGGVGMLVGLCVRIGARQARAQREIGGADTLDSSGG